MATPRMTVTFFKFIEKRASYWEARLGRSTIPGSNMALGRGDIPHDLIQFVAEATEDMTDGFWGSVADGATFKSIGRKRIKAGMAVIAKNRDGVARSERLAGRRHAEWIAGKDSAAAGAMTMADKAWRGLGDGESFTLSWPDLHMVEPGSD